MKRKEKIKEFQRESKKELERSLKEKKDHLRSLRFNLESGKIKNVREIREIKKDIARINTILNYEKKS